MPKRILLIPVLLASLMLAACKDRPAVEEEIRPVRTTVVGAAAVAATQRFAADIRARHESPQGFRVAGKVTERLVDPGAMVRAGQPLLRLDPADLGLELTARQAQLAAAESDYRQQETDLARYQGLLAQHFISQAEFDRRASGVVVAHEKVKQARADLAVSQNRRAYATLTAERDGVVSRIDAEPGQVVQAGQTVVTLAVPGEREAVVNVPEARLAAFRAASAYRVQLWNDGRYYPATLRELAPVADPVSRTYQARLSIPAADDAVKLGMSATVFVTGRDQPAQMRLPLTAVLDEQGRHAVWVLDGKTLRVKKRAVTLAGIDSQTVTVASGLQAGETVVTAGVHLLRDGMRVRRLDPSPRPGKPALAQVGNDKATASGGQP